MTISYAPAPPKPGVHALQYVHGVDEPGGTVRLQLGIPLVAVAVGLLTKGKTRKAAFAVAAGYLLYSTLR